STQDTARGKPQELDDGLDLGLLFRERLELPRGVDELEPRPIQHAEGVADVADMLRREAAALQPLGVDTVRRRRLSDSHHVRRYVARHRGVVRYEGVSSDLAELMDAREPA